VSYDVDAGIFEGSLSLMTELAKHDLLDVFLVKLQALTAQYHQWAKQVGLTLNELSEPLPLLGQLVAIKARRLLPQPSENLEEDEPAVSLEELERRLREYEQFKSVAQILAELHALQHEHLTRLNPQLSDEDGDAEPQEPAPLAIGLIDLMGAFAKVLDQAKVPTYEVEQEAWTVEMKVDELRVMLTIKRRVAFVELFQPTKSTLELVVTFLALLELVRQRMCEAVQDRPFGDIMIVRRELAT